MTLEQRFGALSADYVVTCQDLALCRKACADHEAAIAAYEESLDHAKGLLLALEECCLTGPGLSEGLSSRVREWLASLEDG